MLLREFLIKSNQLYHVRINPFTPVSANHFTLSNVRQLLISGEPLRNEGLKPSRKLKVERQNCVICDYAQFSFFMRGLSFLYEFSDVTVMMFVG